MKIKGEYGDIYNLEIKKNKGRVKMLKPNGEVINIPLLDIYNIVKAFQLEQSKLEANENLERFIKANQNLSCN
jgi:hypothetical protein